MLVFEGQVEPIQYWQPYQDAGNSGAVQHDPDAGLDISLKHPVMPRADPRFQKGIKDGKKINHGCSLIQRALIFGMSPY